MALAGAAIGAAGIAGETAAALALPGAMAAAAGIAAETDEALEAGGFISGPIGLAAEGGSALAPPGSIIGAVGLAAANDNAIALVAGVELEPAPSVRTIRAGSGGRTVTVARPAAITLVARGSGRPVQAPRRWA